MTASDATLIITECMKKERAWQVTCKRSKEEVEAYLIGYEQGMSMMITRLIGKGIIDNSAQIRADIRNQTEAERYNRAPGHNR